MSNIELQNNLLSRFRSSQFSIKPRDEVLEFITKRLSEKIEGNKFYYIQKEHLLSNTDILCSLLQYVNHPLLELDKSIVDWREIFYLFINKIAPPCKYNNPNKKAKFYGFKIGYRGHEEDRGLKESSTKLVVYNNSRQNIIDNYISKQYNLKSKEEVLEFINARLKNTDNGHKSHYIQHNHLTENIDILCSLLQYTHHPLFEPLTNKIKWVERFYLFLNNTTPPALYNSPNKKAKFTTLEKGYIGQVPRSCIHTELITEKIPESLRQQGFTILNDNVTTLADTRFALKCDKCNQTFEKLLYNGEWKDIQCPICNHIIYTGSSKTEKEVAKILTENNIVFQENIKGIIDSGELDIYIPSKNLAIEFNGILWHSFGKCYPNNADLEEKNKYRHLQKTKECQQEGIQLIHIFDGEWKLKQDIVKSIILSKLGIYKERIYARKCEIKIITKTEKRKFLNNNHLQGDCKSTYNIGLYYNNELISVMILGRRKITGGLPQLEMIRFCSKLHTQVIGGASKLLQYFINEYNPKEIISYADRRYSNGNLYKHLNFTLLHESNPNYWYTTDLQNLIHRAKFQKHKLSKILGSLYNAELTETENMYKSNYRKIYDCGSFVFKWNKTNVMV